MPLYAVSYDLHNKRDYQPVWDGLREVGGKKLLESLWLIDVDDEAADVKDWMKMLLDGDDSVAVVELQSSADWATYKAQQDGNEWLEANL
jgi:hypothetical protein